MHKSKIIALIILIAFALSFSGCTTKRKKNKSPAPPVVVAKLAELIPWSLTVTPIERRAEVENLITIIVKEFHEKWMEVNIPIRFVATPGYRWCGPIWTVGCNREWDLIELDSDWTVWVVAHDIFHVFAEQFENPFHNNPYPRDVYHEDPRWDMWNAWRDKLIVEIRHN